VYQKKGNERLGPVAGFPVAPFPAVPDEVEPSTLRTPEPKPAPNPVWPLEDGAAGSSEPAPAAEIAAPSVPVWGSLAEAQGLIDGGDKDKALGMLIGLAQAGPQASYEAFLVAKLYASRLQLYEAEHWVNIAIERDPLLAPAHYVSGLILQEYGRIEGALASLRRCNYADPEFALGHFALAGLLHRLGQQRRALKELENVERILETQDPEGLVPEGDGLTAGRLRELVEVHKELLG
jgi:chemotaxis protein methyltransferase CheR